MKAHTSSSRRAYGAPLAPETPTTNSFFALILRFPA